MGGASLWPRLHMTEKLITTKLITPCELVLKVTTKVYVYIFQSKLILRLVHHPFHAPIRKFEQGCQYQRQSVHCQYAVRYWRVLGKMARYF